MSAKKGILFSAVAFITGLAALRAGTVFYDHFTFPALEGPLKYVLPLAALYIIIRAFHISDMISFSFSEISGWLKKGSWIIAAGLIFFVLSLLALPEDITADPFAIFSFVILCFFTALFEELLFRGIIQNILAFSLPSGQNPRFSFFLPVVLSSAVFGMTHLLNFTVSPGTPVSIISQVIYTFLIGLLLGTIYRLSDSLAAPVILHMLFNFFGSVSFHLTFPDASNAAEAVSGAPSDIPVLQGLMYVLILLPCLPAALRAYRKSHRINAM